MAELLAMGVAGALSLLLTPVMRLVALRFGIVDEPAPRKFHSASVPYLGGVSIMAATLIAAAVALAQPAGRGVVVVLAAALALGLVGLADDVAGLGALVRLAAQTAAAGIVAAAGVRLEIVGSAGIDVVLTVLGIVLLTNAFNMIDNMDGLAGGVAVATGSGVVVLAALGGLEVAAVLGGATVGAAAGYLVWNLSPRPIYMGDAGSMFLGFLLAVAALEVVAIRGTPRTNLVVLGLLAGVLVLDFATVVIDRLAHGAHVGAGNTDHLSHRLVARGRSPRAAAATLVLGQVAMVALAVVIGRGVVPAGWGVVAGVVAGGWLTWAALDAPVYGVPRRRWIVVAAGLIAAGLIAGALLLAGAGPSAGPGVMVSGGEQHVSPVVLALLAIPLLAAAMAAVWAQAYRDRSEPASGPAAPYRPLAGAEVLQPQQGKPH